jgi:hypothetical protein
MHDPTPGGSRTPLKGYTDLYRLRAGEFRIIYTYNDKVVELLTLRRRDEATYDDLDHLEIQQIEELQNVSRKGSVKHSIPDWAELTKTWAAPKQKKPEPLPEKITPAILDELKIPTEFREQLLSVRTWDDLTNCESVPSDVCYKVLDRVVPRNTDTTIGQAVPVVVQEDLVPATVANVSGPLDASVSEDRIRPSRKSATGGVLAPLLIVATRKNEAMSPYQGNAAWGTGKEAKYTVKLDGTVQLTYTVSKNERALLTTDGHAELVGLVNEAKRRGGATQGGGGFVINEYRHVLVPTQDGQVLYAGTYTRDLEFTFDGSLISPVAPSGIQRGDIWPGPHVGIRYTLAAGATNIRWDKPTPRGTKTVSLADHYSLDELSELLAMCRSVKPQGGALYINEARELFAPVERSTGYERVYIGHLGSRPWFPEPE